jgi:hypothetical protein
MVMAIIPKAQPGASPLRNFYQPENERAALAFVGTYDGNAVQFEQVTDDGGPQAGKLPCRRPSRCGAGTLRLRRGIGAEV